MALNGLNKVIIMGFCPNCGSWVDEGDTCTFCGGGSGGSSIDELISYLQRTKFSAWNLKKESRMRPLKKIWTLLLKLDSFKNFVDFQNPSFGCHSKLDFCDRFVLKLLVWS